MMTPAYMNRILLVGALVACAASARAQQARSKPTPSVGETAEFGVKIIGVAYGPDRVNYEMTRAAYITIIVVDETSILSIVPSEAVPSSIESAGAHVSGLTRLGSVNNVGKERFGSAPGVDLAAVTAAAYERCMVRAAQTARAQAQNRRVVVGRDSAGRPIYGPAEPTMDDQMRAEAACGSASRNSSQQPPQGPVSVPSKKNRFLFIYATDTPVDAKTIAALAITENDPKLMAIAMGKKLFDVRGARWAGYYIPW
jgi:hypothetical protein